MVLRADQTNIRASQMEDKRIKVVKEKTRVVKTST